MSSSDKSRNTAVWSQIQQVRRRVCVIFLPAAPRLHALPFLHNPNTNNPNINNPNTNNPNTNNPNTNNPIISGSRDLAPATKIAGHLNPASDSNIAAAPGQVSELLTPGAAVRDADCAPLQSSELFVTSPASIPPVAGSASSPPAGSLPKAASPSASRQASRGTATSDAGVAAAASLTTGLGASPFGGFRTTPRVTPGTAGEF